MKRSGIASTKRALTAVVMTAGLVPAACNPVEIPTRTMPEVVPPTTYTASGGTVPPPFQWWTAFQDDALNTHVSRAIEANLDLRQSWARLAQATAQARIAGAPLLPEVNLTSSAARSRSDGGGISYQSSWVVGFGLAWEVDLWRRIANRAEASARAAAATRQDVENTALVLSGTVTDTWFTVREQAELIAVIESQVALSEKLLEIIEYRYANGLADALQVYQQRQQLEGVRAQLPPARSSLETSLNALAVLQGTVPEDPAAVTVAPSLPPLPPLPELAAPADLVDARPDLRAARNRLAAADLEVAAAVADLLPTVSLSLGYDFNSNSFADPFTSGVSSLGGSLLQPLFDNDRRGAEVVRRRAIVQERLDAFSQAFLTALREVEDALDRERYQLELLAEIKLQLDLAEKQLKAATTSYADGVAEYLDVISAVQTQQSLQRQQVTAHKQLLAYRSTLYRALGGAWMSQLEPPKTDAKLEADVAQEVHVEEDA
ncbi:MAG: efflux transporter outer membrane subunit [Phycisphaerales bacterium]|nr:efflux transporter outer membrane subunit [Phycisphaerales bacterium]